VLLRPGESSDGYHFERVGDQPVLSPGVEGFDGATIQDPRIIKMETGTTSRMPRAIIRSASFGFPRCGAATFARTVRRSFRTICGRMRRSRAWR